MTVQECVVGIPFEEMAERVLAFNPQMEYSIGKFKEAYDIVRLMELTAEAHPDQNRPTCRGFLPAFGK